MLALVAIALAAAPSACSRGGDRCRDERDRAGAARRLAFFEFAPAGGLGMGAACACTTPTGAKGEALTFTRDSAGTCLKGSTLAIANGDMVTCSTDQPRVMYGGDGTGGLGLLVEPARTNTALRSQEIEIDGGVWLPLNQVSAAPLVTSNAGVAPDGTTTAERIQFAACTAGNYSVVYQPNACAGGSNTRSVFLKGVSGSGTTTINPGSGAAQSCSFNATTWTRCVQENVAVAAHVMIGNNCAPGGTLSAADVYVWGAQCELGASASSYIPTAGSTVERKGELATFALTLPTEDIAGLVTVVNGNLQAFGATLVGSYGLGLLSGVRVLTSYINSSQYVYMETSTTHAKFGIALDGVDTNLTGTADLAVGSPNVFLGSYAHGATTATQSICLNGACSTQTEKLTLDTGAVTLYLGAYPSGSQAGAVVKSVSVVPTVPASATAWSSDSISLQSGAYMDYAASATRVVDMFGVSGATIGNCRTQWDTYRRARDTRLVIQCGVNDIGAGSTGAATWALMAAYIEAVQTQGVEVIATNIMPFGGSAYDTAPKETQRLAFNAAMATYCGTHPALICVDAESAVWNPADHTELDPSFDSGDHLHMNSAGGEALADAIFAEAP